MQTDLAHVDGSSAMAFMQDPMHNLSMLRSRRLIVALLDHLEPTGNAPEDVLAQLAAMSDDSDDDDDDDDIDTGGTVTDSAGDPTELS